MLLSNTRVIQQDFRILVGWNSNISQYCVTTKTSDDLTDPLVAILCQAYISLAMYIFNFVFNQRLKVTLG